MSYGSGLRMICLDSACPSRLPKHPNAEQTREKQRERIRLGGLNYPIVGPVSGVARMDITKRGDRVALIRRANPRDAIFVESDGDRPGQAGNAQRLIVRCYG